EEVDAKDAGWAGGVAHSAPQGGRLRAAFLLVRLGLEQALRQGVADELGAGGQTELLHDVRAVRLGRAHRDVQLLGDLLVRVAERKQAQYLALAIGEGI